MRFIQQCCMLVAFATCAVFALRPDDRSKGETIEGASTAVLKNNQSGLRSALLSDFAEKTDSARGSMKFSSVFNGQQSIVAHANKTLRTLESEAKISGVTRDAWGITHIRLQQYHKGLPVLGGEIIAHLNAQNQLIAVSGKWAPTMSIDTSGTMTQKKAKILIDTNAMGVRYQRDPQKVVFENRIGYESIVVGAAHSKKRYRVITDAKTGEILIKAPLIIEAGPGPNGANAILDGQRLSGEDGSTVTVQGWHNTNGNYFLSNKDSIWGVFNVRTNDWEQRATASWGSSDPAAFSLGRNIATVQSWVMTVLGRNSFDNAGSQIVANVHEGYNYVNAYWDGSQLHFGDGDGVTANPLTVIDVVGHEYGHAITQYTSNLDYFYESGALNESYSDILGTIIEFATEPDGRSAYPHAIPGKADWLCGEDCWLDGDALRDLENPQRFGQPSFYKGTLWYTGGDDNGGVHYNSGVQNFAFYLLSEGGTGTNDGHAYSINGLGINASRDIALYANMYLLTSSSQYRDSRDAWMLAASILNYDTATVRDVWTAAGLPPLEKHLEAAPIALDYGKVGVGLTDTLWVELANTGAANTSVASFTATNSVFTVGASIPVIVPALGTVRVAFIYTPHGFGADTGSILLSSDAMDHPHITIVLQGTATQPAAMVITPLSIKASLNSGDSTASSIAVTNNGEADLKIYAVSKYDQSESGPAVKTIAGNPSKAQSYSQRYGNKTAKIKTASGPLRLGSVPSGTKALYISTILFSDSSTDIFVNQLRQLEGMEQLDVVSALDKTPTLALMQEYDAVIVASDYGFADPTLLGNTLADYVDAGGKVILLVASIASSGPYALGGRIALPEYMPIVTGGPDINGGYSPVFIQHPITDGITTLSTGIPIATTSVTASGHSLGTYQDGSLVGAYNADKPVVAINVFPEDGNWDGDLTAMTGNAINWLASKGAWLTVKPQRSKITVKASEACTLSVGLNAGELFGGIYTGAVALTHNDPAKANPMVVPCTLSVRGVALFSVSQNTLAYDTVWTDRSKTITLAVSNPGTSITTITGLSSNNPAFTFSAPTIPFALAPRKTLKIPLTFSPTATAAYTGKVTFTTTAESGGVVTVALSGYGIAPPKISIKPLTVGATLDMGKTSTQMLRITNQGGATFRYSLQLSDSTAGTLGSSTLYGAFGDSIYRIDPTSGEYIGKPIIVKRMSTPAAIAFDGQSLYAGVADSTIAVINPASGAVSGTIHLPATARVSDVGVSDTLIAVSSLADSTVYIYKKRSFLLAASWRLPVDATGQIAMRGATGEMILNTFNNLMRFNALTGQKIADILTWIPSGDELSYAAQSNVLIHCNPLWPSISCFTIDSISNYINEITIQRPCRGICANEAGNALPWASLQAQTNGTLKGAGAYIDVPVLVNSFQVPSGTTNGMITITNRDGGAPGPYTVSCFLTVNPKSLLSTTSKTVVFDTTWTGSVGTAGFELYNGGSAPTEIRGITVTGSVFSFSATMPVVVKPYRTAIIKGLFSPISKGSNKGQFVFQSTAADNPKITIAVSGVSVAAPKLTPSKTSIVPTLLPGDTTAMSVVLSNSGDVAYPFFLRGRSSFTSVGNPFKGLSANNATLYQSSRGVIGEMDPVSGRQIGKTITVSTNPYIFNELLAFDGTHLYWTNGYDSLITVADPVLRRVTGTIRIPANTVSMVGLAVTPTHILMLSNDYNRIILLDKSSGLKVGEWSVPYQLNYVSSICGGGSQGSVYVSDGYQIVECDESTGAVFNSLYTPVSFRSLDYSTSANLLVASPYYGGSAYYLDPQTGSVVDSVQLSPVDSFGMVTLACDEAGIPPTWVGVTPRTGIVPAHGSATVSVKLDAKNLTSGIYVGSLDAVYTGKTSAAPLSIGCTLTVINAGRLSVAPTSLNFGNTVIQTPKTMQLTLSNSGNVPVTVSSVRISNAAFKISSAGMVVAPLGTVQVPVVFTPTKVASYTGTITITSDAFNSPSTVSVKGAGVKK